MRAAVSPILWAILTQKPVPGHLLPAGSAPATEEELEGKIYAGRGTEGAKCMFLVRVSRIRYPKKTEWYIQVLASVLERRFSELNPVEFDGDNFQARIQT